MKLIRPSITSKRQPHGVILETNMTTEPDPRLQRIYEYARPRNSEPSHRSVYAIRQSPAQNAPSHSQSLMNDTSAAALPAGVGVPALGLQTHARSLSWSRVSGPGLIQRQLLRDGGEQLPHILSRLSRRLKEQQASLLSVGLGVGGRDSALVGLLADEIELVSGEGDDDVLVGLALELLDPSLCLVQRGLFR